MRCDASLSTLSSALLFIGLATQTALAGEIGGWPGATAGIVSDAEQASFTDVDGDGRSDLVLRDLDNEISVHLSADGGFSTAAGVLAMGGEHLPGQALFADVNGDGRSDLVFRSVSTTCETVINWCSPRGCAPPLCAPGQIQTRSTWCTAQDCPSDDICTACRRECRDCDVVQSILVGLSTGEAFATPEVWVDGLVGDNGDYDADQLQLGDLTGDGRADLVFRGTGNLLQVAISTGTGFLPPEDWISFGGDYHSGQLQLTDLDGDGKLDAVFRAVETICTDMLVSQRGCDYVPLCPAGTTLVRDSGCEVNQNSSTGDITRGISLTCRRCTGSSTAFQAAFSTGTGFTAPGDWPADRRAVGAAPAN